MFKKILVATDGSEHASKAVDLAVDLANKYDAHLTVMHVLMHGEPSEELVHMAEIEHLVPAMTTNMPAVANMPASMAAVAHEAQRIEISAQMMESLAETIISRAERVAKDAGVLKVETMVEDGDAAGRILATAARQGCDLIVLGTRGLGNLKGLLMGSVSQKVSHLSDCTCIAVK